MAILDSVPQVVVTVRIDDKPVEEYAYDEEITGPLADKTVVKYIEAVTGANFTVHYEVLPGYKQTQGDGLSFGLRLDGRTLPSNMIIRNGPLHSNSAEDTGFTVQLSDNNQMLQLFQFSPLTLAENGDEQVGDGLGEIVVEVFRITAGKPKTQKEAKKYIQKKLACRKNQDSEQFSEIALKGKSITHRISRGTHTTEKIIKIMDSTYFDEFDRPFVTFIFRYRSRKALQDLLLLPREATPKYRPESDDSKSKKEESDPPAQRDGVKSEQLDTSGRSQSPQPSVQPGSAVTTTDDGAQAAKVKKEADEGSKNHAKQQPPQLLSMKREHEHEAAVAADEPADPYEGMTLEQIQAEVRQMREVEEREQAIEEHRKLREKFAARKKSKPAGTPKPETVAPVGVKRERSDDSGNGAKDGSARAAKRLKQEPGETVDLTDD